jgi:hypothetical protein
MRRQALPVFIVVLCRVEAFRERVDEVASQALAGRAVPLLPDPALARGVREVRRDAERAGCHVELDRDGHEPKVMKPLRTANTVAPWS